ncbi:MAG: amidohydrolase family protein [Planctomycetota bacterium]|nr:amidohydrolase family protein [Planctomycetota bacterium]
MNLLLPISSLALAGVASGAALFAPTAPTAQDVAIQAGRIYLVEDGAVIENGTVLVRAGRIVAIGEDVSIPRGVRVVDYGPDAVLTPGLVSADSGYGSSIAAERTASPTLRASDHFDPYSNLKAALGVGVTSVYLAPARGRLIAGQGAVIKTYGEEGGQSRLISASACLHGSIAAEARRTPGYWEVPVPATVDVGLGVEQPQLPRSTMGAIVALEELLSLSDAALAEEYGAEAGPALKALMASNTPWRMGAGSVGEVCALLEFFGKSELPLVLDSDYGAAEKPEMVAAAGVAVIAGPQGRSGTDFGAGPDSNWPDSSSISRLVAAGVSVAIVARNGVDVRAAAALARRGGMSAEQALRSVTLVPAEVLGVADRVGSLAVGKDADFAVFNGDPMQATSSVLATWVSGELAHKSKSDAATVLEVEELHLGDGHVLRPGQLLMKNGRVTEIGTVVAHPRGATVVRGVAAMPGMIDVLGYLGTEGSNGRFDPRFDLRRILETGDDLDRRVAKAGITTVNMGAKSATSPSTTMAYKPAGEDLDRMVVSPAACIRLNWNNSSRTEAGKAVRATLAKAAEYKKKWEEYEVAIAKWTPPVPEEAKKDDEEEDEDEEGEDAKEEEESKDEPKKKKKKGEKAPARPVTGEWKGTVASEDGEHDIRVRLLERNLGLEGTLRADGVDELVSLEGARDGYHVTLRGLSSLGVVTFDLQLEDKALSGQTTLDGVEAEATLEQVSDVYPVAQRSVETKPASVSSPKGKPKSPGIDANLEPIRQAMLGKGAVVVAVDRDDDILACVAACEAQGIKPILWGAKSALKVAGQIKGRVAGIVTSTNVAGLSQAGIPIAFASQAEQGAAALPQRVAAFVAGGMSPTAAMRSLTSDAARMFALDDRIGFLREGFDADVLLLDGSPLDVSSAIQRVWVNGEEIR